MARSQPVYAPASGGLVLNSNKFDLLDSPGVATRLRNYEVSLKGGYRRINGHVYIGGEDATRPDGNNPILGVHPYALGYVVVVNDGVYYTEDGVSWTQVNVTTTVSGDTEANLPGLTELPRSSQGKAQIILTKGSVGHTSNPYGVLTIATGPNKLAHFYIEGTGSGRLFFYLEDATITKATFLATNSKHLCVVDTIDNPSTVSYSRSGYVDDFTGAGSGSIALPAKITGIKSFRDVLYIFCENSIHKLLDIGDPTTTRIEDVTTNMGCVDGNTIQEIGGDLIFLASDGFRSVAATSKIDDVELSSVGSGVQSIIAQVLSDRASYTFSSVVIRGKNQYRFFYTNGASTNNGLCGTLRTGPDGTRGFQWTELRELEVRSISSYYDSNGVEVICHGDNSGYVHLHDVGNSFNGADIEAEWQSPDVHFGDLGLRKTLHYFNLALTNEGSVNLLVQVSFDFQSPNTTQPSPVVISFSGAPAIFGSALFASSIFGDITSPLPRTPLQGSGHSLAFRFYSKGTNPPHTIHGYHVEITPSGRK